MSTLTGVCAVPVVIYGYLISLSFTCDIRLGSYVASRIRKIGQTRVGRR